MTTIGQLVSVLFSEYQEKFHDEELAAVATQIAIDELLGERKRLGSLQGGRNARR
jgi:hypothetical protein